MSNGGGGGRGLELTGMSPLSNRLSNPLRASPCDMGGGVSYRGGEERSGLHLAQLSRGNMFTKPHYLLLQLAKAACQHFTRSTV